MERELLNFFLSSWSGSSPFSPRFIFSNNIFHWQVT
jgi:hypothetical protein